MSYILEKITNNEIQFLKKKNVYKMQYDDKNIKILSPKLKIPFGVENFNNKLILNLELDKNKNNDTHNFSSIIKSIENYLINLDRICDVELKNFTYCSSYKNRPDPFCPLLRTSIKKYGKKILTKICSKSDLKTLHDIKKNDYISVLLEIESIWVYGDKYGINWTLNTIYA